ncbi:cupin domain-containing protein [Phyllobacterium sp. 21LDTY02-6]|uniref:cupin domain-containing protein n=1 Tax=unclassified Phyllobacterium TaxID=2638441 RepID=UPI0020200C3E|nr:MULTISPECIES: cupin domain-containing protein [unclassified Phyllobacterium]MCO4318880.1 cupin domain-containing protein [Phyllobacterium sp. 21LDTY02-6]MCX8278906.1 cupin domain-containing protein [Phyllobacterium sp. 0TCS1.6C]MCX8293690.1 cupin domain-containing protein [Phyllobacterium sp. 0TCS1.6A]
MNLRKGGLALVAALAIGGVTVTGALAQSVFTWTPKPVALAPYKHPNKPRTTIADVRARIPRPKQTKTWHEQVVSDKHLQASWVQMAVGDQSPAMFISDTRAAFIVWEGSIEFTVGSQAPFTATKGSMVQVPARTQFQMKNVGPVPSLHFEVFTADAKITYPQAAATLPKPQKGMTWALTRQDPGEEALGTGNVTTRNFTTDPAAFQFVVAPGLFLNAIRGSARDCNMQPPTALGHRHINYGEFWFIMEGQIQYNIEGLPGFVSEAGDIVYVPAGRWHSAANYCPGFDTRIAINPFPTGTHNWPPTASQPNPPMPPLSGRGWLD